MRKTTIKKLLAILEPPKRVSLTALTKTFTTKGMFDRRSIYILDKIRAVRIGFKNLEGLFAAQEKSTSGRFKAIAKDLGSLEKRSDDILKNIDEKFETLRKDILTRSQSHGGGNANRQIRVDGTDVLTKYTDVNLVSGTGVSITSANDETNKRRNITVTAGSLSPQTPTGTVNGSNTDFTFTTAPQLISVDQGRFMQKTSSDGTVNWTGTTTVTLTVAPTFDIFGV